MIKIKTLEKGRKADGNRSIADKIIKRLHDLEKTLESNQGRWAWELLQNAKDSVADDTREVDVYLSLNGNSVTFMHNGNNFTEYDIRGLINQISSKEVEEGQKATRVGRFGTGFITTHLLSRIVNVKGFVETDENELYQFDFSLDREGGTTSILAPKVESTWEQFHQSTKRVLTNNPLNFNTSFTYQLSNERQRVTAQKGIEEFTRLMPFVLAFNPKIGKVQIINNDNLVFFERQPDSLNEFIVQVERTINNTTQKIQIAISKNEIATVALEIDPTTNSVKEWTDVPRIFCDFPLIGTEKFYFPVVVNSFYFNPQTERDGIWLRGNEDKEVNANKSILEDSVLLYEDLLVKISNLGIKALYFVANTKLPDVNEKYFDTEWYKSNIQQPLREVILKTPIVDTISRGRCSIELVGGGYVDFPHHATKKIREQLWLLGYNLDGAHLILPEKESIDFWDEIIWDKKYHLDLEQYAIFFNKWSKNIKDFSLKIGENRDVFHWLNDFFNLIVEEQKLELFNQFDLIPNQNGNFKKLTERTNHSITYLLYIDEINDETLLEILKLFGGDWKEYLIHTHVQVPLTSAVLKKPEISASITKCFEQLKNEWSENAIKAIVLLTEWFEYNAEQGKEFFPELYRRRAELFMNTIEDKENLYKVMKSKTPLSILSTIASAIENDPEILNIIKRRQQEQQEEYERNEIGEFVEQLLKEVLEDYGFQVIKDHVGSDLFISLNGAFSYDIEVKSISSAGFVKLTPTQASMASNNSAHYALCVVQKDGTPLTKDYVRSNARFVTNIGNLVFEKVNTMNQLKSKQNQISNEPGEIEVIFENSLEFKYKIGQGIWSSGLDFGGFIRFANELS